MGQSGTIPFGMSAPVSPAGSCPANLSGPIPDGSQLVSITQNPGNTATSGSTSPKSSTSKPAAPSQAPPTAAQNVGVGGSSMTTPGPTAPSSTGPAPKSSPAPASGGSFLLSNGQAAQQLNAQFASLTSSSPCTGSPLPSSLTCINTDL